MEKCVVKSYMTSTNIFINFGSKIDKIIVFNVSSINIDFIA